MSSFNEKAGQIAKKQGVPVENAKKMLAATAKKSVAKSKAAGKKPKANMARVVKAQKSKPKSKRTR